MTHLHVTGEVPYAERLRRLQNLDGVPSTAVQNYVAWVIRVPESRIVDAEPVLAYDTGKGPCIALEWEGGPGGVIDFYAELYGDGSMWLCVVNDENTEDVDRMCDFDAEVLDNFFVHGRFPE